MNKTVLGHIAAIFAVCALAVSARSISALGEYLSSAEILIAALTLSILVLNIAYLPRHRVKKRSQELTFALAGLCGTALWFYLRSRALGYVTSNTFALTFALVPVGCALVLRITGRLSRVSGSCLAGFGFAAAGILALSRFRLDYVLTGYLFMLGAAVSLAAFLACYKAVVHTGHGIAILRRVLLWGAVFSIPLCFIFDFDVESYLALFSLAPALHLLIGVSALPCAAALALGYSHKTLGAERSAAYLYALPIAPVVITAVSTGGSVGAFVFIGTVLIIVGITLSTKR